MAEVTSLEKRIADLELRLRQIGVGGIRPGGLQAFSDGSCTNNCTAACTIGCTSGCTGGCGSQEVENPVVQTAVGSKEEGIAAYQKLVGGQG